MLLGLLGAGWLTQGAGRSAPLVVLVLTAWVSGKAIVAVLTAVYALHDAAQRDDALGANLGASFGAQAVARWQSQWPFIATIGVTNVVSLLNYRASLFLVERFHGLSVVGTYSVAVTVAELLWLLSSSVTVSAYARIGHPDPRVAAAMTVQAVRINVLATLVAAPVLLLGAWWGLPLVMGPAYAASLVPLAALLCTEAVAVFEPGDQGGTYNGNPLMTAVGIAVLETLLAPGFLQSVIDKGNYLKAGLLKLCDQHGLEGERGEGLLRALKLGSPIGGKIVEIARDLEPTGLLLNSPRPDLLRFMPALNINDDEIRQMINMLRELLKQAM